MNKRVIFKVNLSKIVNKIKSAIYAVIFFFRVAVFWKMDKSEILDIRILKIAQKLKTLRKEKGYSSYENFALNFELDRKQYWRLEQGSNFTIKTLLKVLDIHEITLKDFFDDFYVFED